MNDPMGHAQMLQAKSLVQFNADHGLETEEGVLLGYALQQIEHLQKQIAGRVVTDNSKTLVDALRKIVTLEDLVAKLLAAKVADEDLTEEQELEIIQQHSSKDEWPEDGVSEDFMPFLRWGVHIGIRHQGSKLIPVTEVPR